MSKLIDKLIERLRDEIQTSDGSCDCQHKINEQILSVINQILRTCERDLRKE